MFGFAKRRAAKAAIEHVSPIVRLLEASGGLPLGFWEDPYILGWINGFAMCVARAATNDKIGTADLGQVAIDTVTTLAGVKGNEVVELMRKLARAKEPRFVEAVQAATKTYFVTVGAREFDADPEVVQARQLSKSLAESSAYFGFATSEQGAVGAAMQNLLFYDVVDRMRSRRGTEKFPKEFFREQKQGEGTGNARR
jgi:hypothetical protein